MKTEVVKEAISNKVVYNVVDKNTRKVIGKYVLGSHIKVEYILPEEKPLLSLTVNGMDN